MRDSADLFRAERRGWLRGRVGLFRARVANDQGRQLRVRSPKLAHALAAALNAASADSSDSVRAANAVSRYRTSLAQNKREVLVLAAERGRDSGQFGDGMIAVTDDRQLAEQVAGLLNRLDPAQFKPPPKGNGMGWW